MTTKFGISNCTFALTNDDGEFQVRTDNSVALFYNPPENYTLVITKHNYVPYIANCPNCTIQNMVIENSEHYSGCQHLYIGRNIENYQVEGDVVVQNGGNLTIDNCNEVIITDGFEIKQSGGLLIE